MMATLEVTHVAAIYSCYSNVVRWWENFLFVFCIGGTVGISQLKKNM